MKTINPQLISEIFSLEYTCNYRNPIEIIFRNITSNCDLIPLKLGYASILKNFQSPNYYYLNPISLGISNLKLNSDDERKLLGINSTYLNDSSI